MRRLLAAVTLLVWLPVCALAAPETPYAPETVLQTVPLSDRAQAALEALYPAILRGEETIDLPDKTDYDDANAAMRCLSRNYPELFHLGNTWSVGYYQSAPEYATTVSPTYRMATPEYEARLSRLLEAARAMAGGVTGTQTERAEALHDLLCQRTDYDQSENEARDNTVYGALVDGVTRCEGYAQALSLMYRLAGIPCGTVSGDTFEGEEVIRHAWNVAVIDGTPALIDATWNDQDGGNTHWYYGVTAEMMAVDHVPDEEFVLPECASLAVNWHARRGLLVGNAMELLAALKRFARSGEVSIRFTDEALFRDVTARTNDWFSEYNAASLPSEAFYGAYSVIASEAQRCVMLRRTEAMELPER